MSQEPKPCGNYHPLPCGLDVECPVPPEYFDAEMDSTEIWQMYQRSH